MLSLGFLGLSSLKVTLSDWLVSDEIDDSSLISELRSSPETELKTEQVLRSVVHHSSKTFQVFLEHQQNSDYGALN